MVLGTILGKNNLNLPCLCTHVTLYNMYRRKNEIPIMRILSISIRNIKFTLVVFDCLLWRGSPFMFTNFILIHKKIKKSFQKSVNYLFVIGISTSIRSVINCTNWKTFCFHLYISYVLKHLHTYVNITTLVSKLLALGLASLSIMLFIN